MPGGRYPWAVRAGGPLLGGGGLPTLFDWNPETAQALPATATFTRASVAFYRNGSGLWVEAASGELRLHNAPGGGQQGYLPEPAATNLALHSRDFTNAVWVATNITPAKDATGIDGISNAASTLTATAANGTIFQSFTRASSSHTFSIFVARKTGTGTIEITIDGGSTWVDITSGLSSDIKDDPYTVTQTLANPSIGFRIVTSGNEIEVDVAQLEATAFSTSPIITSGSTVTRVADTLKTGVNSTVETSFLVDATAPSVTALTLPVIAANDTSPDTRVMFTFGTGVFTQAGTGSDQASFTNDVAGERHKYGVSWSDNDNECIIVDDENNSDTGTTTDNWSSDDLSIGYGSTWWRGRIHNFVQYDAAQTQAQLEALVA